MSGSSKTCGPTMCEGTDSVTGSEALEFGLTPYASPDGLTTARSGPEAVPASHSATPERKRRSTTRGIYGQSGLFSSPHDDLSWSLANRLRQRTDWLGSTLFTLTWVTRVTPAGLSISALRASEPLTEGSGCSSWPTPNAGPQNLNDSRWEERRQELKEKHINGNGFGMTLGMASTLASWPTPRATDGDKNVRTPEGTLREIERKGGPQDLCQAAMLAGWPTPTASDGEFGSVDPMRPQGPPNQVVLKHWVRLAINPDGPARLTAGGEMLTGSSAGIGSGGQLRPEHSRWLMGLPAVWCDCAVTAIQSMRQRRRNSSKRS